MSILVVSEKPGVFRAIAAVLGADNKRSSYIETYIERRRYVESKTFEFTAF